MNAPFESMPAFLEANLGPKIDPNTPPEKWVDYLIVHAPKIRRIVVTYARGSKKTYDPIPTGRWDVPAFDPNKASESDDKRHKQNGAGSPDHREWAEDHAKLGWARCIAYADATSRPMRCQLIALEWDEKKGDFKILPGVKATSVPGDNGEGLNAEEMIAGNSGDAKILAWIIVKQQGQLDGVYTKFGSMVGGLSGLFNSAIEMTQNAVAMREEFSQAMADERKEQRAWLKEILEGQQRHESIQKAMERFGPIAEELVEAWMADDGDEGKPRQRKWQRLAAQFSSSITDDQIKKAEAEGLKELIADVRSILGGIASATDRAVAKELVIKLAKVTQPHAKKLRDNVLTEDQEKTILGLFRFAGLPV